MRNTYVEPDLEQRPDGAIDNILGKMTLEQSLLERSAARGETDQIFQLISEEDLYERPLPQRNRLIFYVGHLEAFDWNHLGRFALSEPEIDPTLDALFERGIDPEPGQLPSDQASDWPSIEQTGRYVRSVRDRLDRLWAEAPDEIRQRVLEHRWMHAETLAYLLHNLPHEKKHGPSKARSKNSGDRVRRSDLEIPAGIATLGRDPGTGFGWDNEFQRTEVAVPAFSISKYKVTNGDFLEFVNEGHEAPHFWTCLRGEWFYRGMFDFEPLPLDAPVYVTKDQAERFALWSGKALPTEAQFHRAAYGTPEGFEREYPWGSGGEQNEPDPEVHGNFGFRLWDPVSVRAYAAGSSAFDVAQMVGNGWEWTRTLFGPFPGFTPMANYAGYSADFFDNKHFVMKGGSPRTAKVLLRRSLRNWFRPDYPYVYGTFRMVEN